MKLYNELTKLAKISSFNDFQIEKLAYTLNKQSNKNMEIIYAMILHHATITNVIDDTIPYNGKIYSNGKGIVYTLNNLPTEIIHIIYLFTC